MSDYLTSLAARALGVADVARPRRSLFEPRRGALEPVAAAEPPRSSRGEVTAERDEGTGALPPVLVPEPVPQPLLRTEEPPVSEAPAKPSRREPLRTPARRGSLPGPAPPVAMAPESAQPPPPSETVEPVPAAAKPPVLHRGTDRQVAPEPLLSAQPPRGVDRPEAVAPPSVRVTIGRVDVRAVVPEQPPEPKRKPRSAPRMSLDEYLSRPRSGAR